MTRRILHIIPTLDRAGAEKQLVLLATHLPRDEFDVYVCALTRGGPLAADLEEHAIPLVVLDKRYKLDPAAFYRLRRHIAALKPDLVQTWLFAANAYGRAAALSAGVRTIVAGERCVDRWKRWYEYAIDRHLARRTARIIVNNAGIRDFYVANGLPADKFVVIPGAVAPLGPSDRQRDELLAELGLPSDARLVATVGRLWPQKRHKDLIWSTDLLASIRDDAHLLIIGEGPLRGRLERYTAQIRRSDRVHFLGQRDDLWRLLPHCDVFWLASGYEGLPNSVMEAMTAGVPVVISDIPGNRDLVRHNETGFLFSIGDRAAITRWTNKLLDDAELSARISQAAKRHVTEHFSVEQMVRRHVELYRELLS